MGSANLGNRGTRRTKEVGIVIKNCPKLAEDATKMIDLYWSLYNLKKLPEVLVSYVINGRLCLSVCLLACLPVSHPAGLPACLSNCLSLCLLVSLSANLPAYLPACLPSFPPSCLSPCLAV